MRATGREAIGGSAWAGEGVMEIKHCFGHKSEMPVKHLRGNVKQADGFGLSEPGWGVRAAERFAHFEFEMTA